LVNGLKKSAIINLISAVIRLNRKDKWTQHRFNQALLISKSVAAKRHQVQQALPDRHSQNFIDRSAWLRTASPDQHRPTIPLFMAGLNDTN
jgi:hypothetical protein